MALWLDGARRMRFAETLAGDMEMAMGRWALLGAGMAAIVAAWGGPDVARAEDDPFLLKDPTTLMVGAGSWEVARDDLRTWEVDAALRPDYHLWVIKPLIGITAAGDGDTLVYAGPLVDYRLTHNLVVSVSTSAAYWIQGSFDLGSHLEFHSGAEIAWHFDNDVRVGVGLYHTSNADLTKRNPGSELALIEYSIPIKAF